MVFSHLLCKAKKIIAKIELGNLWITEPLILHANFEHIFLTKTSHVRGKQKPSNFTNSSNVWNGQI